MCVCVCVPHSLTEGLGGQVWYRTSWWLLGVGGRHGLVYSSWILSYTNNKSQQCVCRQSFWLASKSHIRTQQGSRPSCVGRVPLFGESPAEHSATKPWLRNEVLERALAWAWVWSQIWPLSPDFWDALGFSSGFTQPQPAFTALSYESRLMAQEFSFVAHRPRGNWPNPTAQRPSLPPGRQPLNPFLTLFLNLSISQMSSQPMTPGSMFLHPELYQDLVESAWGLT